MSEETKVNPKWIIRRVSECLPPGLDVTQAALVQALWAYSDDFLTEDALELGMIEFSGSASYQQLADHCKIGNSTARKYMRTLREKKIVEWEVGPHWIEFTVRYHLNQGYVENLMREEFEKRSLRGSYPVAAPIATAGETGSSEVATQSGSGRYPVAMETSEVATIEPEVATGVATLSLNWPLNCRTGMTGDSSAVHPTTSNSETVRETLTHPAKPNQVNPVPNQSCVSSFPLTRGEAASVGTGNAAAFQAHMADLDGDFDL